MDKLKIRQAKLADKAALLPQIMVFEEQHAVYDGGKVTERTRLRAEETFIRDTKKKKYWIAKVGGRAIGFIKAEIMDTHPDTLMIDNLYVDKDFRQQGIGTVLITNMEKLFTKKGAVKSRLWVAKMNTNAEKLYKKLGFRYKKDIWKQYIKDIK